MYVKLYIIKNTIVIHLINIPNTNYIVISKQYITRSLIITSFGTFIVPGL